MSDSIDNFDGPPTGLRRTIEDGVTLVDAMAGRASALGLGNPSVVQAIQLVSEDYLGDANRLDSPGESSGETIDEVFAAAVLAYIGGQESVAADRIVLCASADAAVESALRFARSWKTGAFRTVALIGSDHGRTAACRTASGRPELHEAYGPMMAGFAHVPPGDISALKATIDDQTACLLISPIDLHDSARQLQADYLQAARDVCDEHQVALVIDETRLGIGSAGTPFHFSSIADIKADGVILSAGLFGGLPGGLFIGSQRLTSVAIGIDGHANADELPLQKAVALATLSEMQNQNLPASSADASHELAVLLAERVGGFEFVRDLQACGMTIGIETDINAGEIVAAAAKQGLRVESAGDTAIRLQLPLLMSDEDREALITRLGLALEHVEHESADTVPN